MTTFAVRSFIGSAGTFHALALDDDPAPEVWAFTVDRPALVLGSTQREVVDAEACAAAGVEVVRRRSGGGLVLLEPGGAVWFDVVVPAPILRHVGVGADVGASMRWLGERVVAALGELGVDGVDVHRGGMDACSTWCPLVCFAGIGPGEVLRDGVKLVGLSQRRTRAGSRFQCAVHVRWAPEHLTPLLAGPVPAGPAPVVATLPAEVAAAVPAAVAEVLSRDV